MTISDLIQVILMGLLVVVTGIYAWRTFSISKATKKQADASVKMAEEMIKARSPSITIQWSGADPNNKKISANLNNEGFGSALNLTCYLTYKGLDFNKLSWSTTFKVGEKYPLSLPSENFDFKAWNELAINCDYDGSFGGKFRSILRCESEKKRSLEIVKLKQENKPK